MTETVMSLSNRIIHFVEQCFLIVVACAGLIGCNGGTIAGREENAVAKSKMKEIIHPNGLRLNAPENLTIHETADGYLIVPPSSRGMSGLKIVVEENASSEPSSKQKKIGDRTIDYTIEKQAGVGSGGDEYTITAVERIENRTIRYRQSDTAEISEPSFEFFWSLVEATTLNR